MKKSKISYLPLEILLLKEGKNKQYLRNELNIAPSTTTRISKNEIISLDIIQRICDHFDCEIQDVVQFVRVPEEGEGEA